MSGVGTPGGWPGPWQAAPVPLDPAAYGYPSPPRRTGLMIGILAGVGVLVMLSCGGLSTLGLFAYSASLDQAKQPVVSFLTSVQQEDYVAAWRQLCVSERRSVSPEELNSRWDERGRVVSWDLGDPAPTSDGGGSDLVVPATIRFSDGHSGTVRFLLRQESAGVSPQVCGER
jgi:hypothetical protein